MNFVRFAALKGSTEGLHLVAVDIGYAAKRATCGVATSHSRESLNFGGAIDHVARELIARPEAVLVLEAVLSTSHG